MLNILWNEGLIGKRSETESYCQSKEMKNNMTINNLRQPKAFTYLLIWNNKKFWKGA